MNVLSRLMLFVCIVGTVVPGSRACANDFALDTEATLQRALDDFDQAQQLLADSPDRSRQLYRAAAQRFESIVASGIVNGRLEYNLANCYLQAGDLGQAVLHYRRAQRLIPRDPLLADNLAEARSRCLTSIQPTRRSAVLRSVFFWHFETSTAARCRVAVTLYIAFWILLVIRSLAPRKTANVAAAICGVVTLVLACSIGQEQWAERRVPEGVVTEMDVVVHKGPSASYQRQFEQPLQPGVEFTLRERRGSWWKIELADGKSGWVENTAAELVVPPSARLFTMPL